MRLIAISVQNLLRQFSYPIELRRSDRITIIHGPNGYGKTTLLRLINAFYTSSYEEVMRIPFEKLELTFDDDVRVCVTKRAAGANDQSGSEGKPTLLCEMFRAGTQVHSDRLKAAERIHRMSSSTELIRRFLPFLQRIGPTTWLDARTGESIERSEIFARYADVMPFRTDANPDPEWLAEHKQSFHVRFIQSQRLLMRSERQTTPGASATYEYTVSAYAKELSDTINRKVAEYGRLTASYERSFPSRFVAQPDSIVEADKLRILRSDIRSRLEKIDAKRAELQNAGLLDKQTDDQLLLADSFSDAKLIFLDLYTRDIETKLKAFDDLTPKIKLFTDILNHRLSYKHLSISRERGFVITLDNYGSLTPEDLSSGEQHELVLCFELLFKTGPGYFVMIDEPEISLHVEWQEAFLSDLEKIAKVSQFDSLIATHSPIVVGNRWDLTESLSELLLRNQ